MFDNLLGPGGSVDVIMLFIYAIAAIILGIVVYQIVRNFLEWHRNNQSPVEIRQAKLVSKRTHVFGNEMARTNYYVTFEWQKERREFRVKPEEYALLAEGDQGELTFQGSRLLQFKRQD
ncbi:DUF2500 domain-containing protein [Streptococcus sp. ZY1909104]|uniref:DUF2500 family protein n=1 Tax=Streptococcus TaxID=1301 RepID=UPI00147819C9